MAATKTAKRGSSKSSSGKSGSKSKSKTASSKTTKTAAKQGRSANISSLKAGDKVEWSTSQGKTKGTVKDKVTKDTKVKGFKVKASAQNPKVMVQSDKTGKKAAHSPKSLKKVDKSK